MKESRSSGDNIVKNNSDIALIYPPFVHFYLGIDNSYTTPTYSEVPLGIGCLSAYLRDKGYTVSVFDLNVTFFLKVGPEHKHLWHLDYEPFWTDEQKFNDTVLPVINDLIDGAISEILRVKPRFIGFSVYCYSQTFSRHMARRIKEKDGDVVIIFGGPGCDRKNAPSFIEEGSADVVVIGEGEVTLSKIIENYKAAGELKPCEGAYFRIGNDIVFGGERGLIRDLDELPLPDLSQYIGYHRELFGDRLAIPISWLRGCTNRCAFCYETLYWKYPRAKSPQAICEEFEHQSRRYNSKSFTKHDSTLTMSRDHVSQVCDLLIKRKVGVRWDSMARIEEYLTYDLLKKMHDAGCDCLGYGIESGSQKVVDLIGKNFSIEKAEEVLAATKKAGIQCNIFIMVGFPGEGPIDFMRTIWFLHKNRKNIYSVHFGAFGLTPSPMYENPGKYGISIDKWGRWRSGRFWDSPRIIKMKRALLAIVLFFIIEETHSPVMKEQRMLAKLKKFYLNLSASAFRRTGKGEKPASGRP